MQQFQMQNEKEVAALVAKKTEEMVAEEQEYLEANQADPLLELKKRDLDIQESEIQRRAFDDGRRLELDQERVDQQKQMSREKIESQEDIAQLRANVNLSKQRSN